MPLLANFSKEYLLAPEVDVEVHWNEEAVMGPDVFNNLVKFLGEPIVGHVDGIHYEFKPDEDVLLEDVLVPIDNHKAASKPMALLLQK